MFSNGHDDAHVRISVAMLRDTKPIFHLQLLTLIHERLIRLTGKETQMEAGLTDYLGSCLKVIINDLGQCTVTGTLTEESYLGKQK